MAAAKTTAKSEEISAKRYPLIAFRPKSRLQETRIRKQAKRTGKGISGVIQECIDAHLPKLEKKEA